MRDLFKPCPFCKSRIHVRETFGRLVAGCNNEDCSIRPDTWLSGIEIYDVRKLAKFWNRSIKDQPLGS